MFKSSSKSQPKEDTRGRILQAAIQLLQEDTSPETVTVRAVAARAGVGIGLVNYHFGSRDKLVNDAIGQLMAEKVQPYLPAEQPVFSDPREQLIHLLLASAEVASAYPEYTRAMVEYTLVHGQMEVPLMIVPLIQQILGQGRSVQEMRWMAYAVVTTMQAMVVQQEDFHMYAGLQISDPADQEQMVRFLVNQIIH